jgi:hypothetical protein
MAQGNGAANGAGAPGASSNRQYPHPAYAHALHALDPTECFDLLEPGGIGRVGFASADGVVIVPVNFALTGKSIIFRTAPDTLLALHGDGHLSFQVDHFDQVLHEGWSVLVHGHAHQVNDEREVKHLEDAAPLQPWAGGARDVYVRIAPIRISGRRIQPD